MCRSSFEQYGVEILNSKHYRLGKYLFSSIKLRVSRTRTLKSERWLAPKNLVARLVVKGELHSKNKLYSYETSYFD